MNSNDLNGESAFVEQAEYLDTLLFSKWLVHHPNESTIVRKLRASGAKLLSGPRGTGKTTLMLRAYALMIRSPSEVLPVYVNFKTSLRLEPLYRASGNATFWFRQWLLIRTAVGVSEACHILDIVFPWDLLSLTDKSNAQRVINALQVGATESAALLIPEPLTTAGLNNAIRVCLGLSSRERAVLLFDDAAHAFSSEQQRDFFDFFREIKSTVVSPKAAIYPGITDFSSAFHVGHDAEEINVWLDPSEATYLPFMKLLLQKRLPLSSFTRIEQDDSAFRVLALAAFGVPRNLLNMIREIIGDELDGAGKPATSLSRQKILKSVTSCANTSMQIFKSLKKKLPVYAKFIEVGEELLNQATQVLKEYNSATTKAATETIALTHPIAPEVRTLIAFLQYAGLARPRGDLRRGEKGTFWLIDVHYALLVDANAIVAKRSVSLSELAATLSKRDAHAFARSSIPRLLGTPDITAALPLMLPPCQVCNTERAVPTARFCLNCGAPLTVSSTFETAVSQDLSVLPLTTKRVKSIRDQSNIFTIKDVLLDKDHKGLLGVHMIGPVWATRISRYAEEFVE